MKKIKSHNILARSLALLLVLCMIATNISSEMLIAYAAENEESSWEVGEDVTATLHENGVLELSGSGKTWNYSNEESDRAPFYEVREQIINVEIEDGITSIGDYLFYNCENLTGTLTIPETVQEIGDYAFNGDENAPAFRYIFNEFESFEVEEKVEASVEEIEIIPVGVSAEETESAEEPDEQAAEEAEEKSEEEETPEEPEAQSEEEETPEEPEAQSEKEETPEEPEAQSEEEETPEEPEAQSEEEETPEKPEEQVAEETIKKEIKKQEIGENIFAETEGTVFEMEESENDTFREAAEEAGYKEIASWEEVIFEDGFGNVIAETVAVTEDGIFMPSYDDVDLSWPEESYSDYTFNGWKASDDVTEAYDFYPGEEKQFVADWTVTLRELKEQTISAEVGNQLIEISGNIPVGATVSAEEVEVSGELLGLVSEVTGTEEPVIFFALDITILVDGIKYQPCDYGESVVVNIRNLDSEPTEDLSIVHISEDAETEALSVVETVVPENVTADAVEFTAESFSYYIGTVVPNNTVKLVSGAGYYFEYQNGAKVIEDRVKFGSETPNLCVVANESYHLLGVSVKGVDGSEGATSSITPVDTNTDGKYEKYCIEFRNSSVDQIITVETEVEAPGGTVSGTSTVEQVAAIFDATAGGKAITDNVIVTKTGNHFNVSISNNMLLKNTIKITGGVELQITSSGDYKIKRDFGFRKTDSHMFDVAGDGSTLTLGSGSISNNTITYHFNDGTTQICAPHIVPESNNTKYVTHTTVNANVSSTMAGTLTIDGGAILPNYTGTDYTFTKGDTTEKKLNPFTGSIINTNIGNATVNMWDDVVLQNNMAGLRDDNGSAMTIRGTLNMYGGIIRRCVNVIMDGKLEFGNSAGGDGGGIILTGRAAGESTGEKVTTKAFMYGGEITECEADNGSAIGIWHKAQMFYMGGHIHRNLAGGGHVFPSDAVCIYNMGELYMYDGTISDNQGGHKDCTEDSCKNDDFDPADIWATASDFNKLHFFGGTVGSVGSREHSSANAEGNDAYIYAGEVAEWRTFEGRRHEYGNKMAIVKLPAAVNSDGSQEVTVRIEEGGEFIKEITTPGFGTATAINPDLSILLRQGNYTIIVSSISMQKTYEVSVNENGTYTITRTDRAMLMPELKSKTPTDVTLKVAGTENTTVDGTLLYGYAPTNNSDEVPESGKGSWQLSPTFENVKGYNYFFIKSSGASFAESISDNGLFIAMADVKSVEVYGAEKVQPGDNYHYKALVLGEDETPDQTVTWTVEGNTHPDTRINQYGVLYISQYEVVGTQLTVKAVSAASPDKEDEMIVTVVDKVSNASLVSLGTYVDSQLYKVLTSKEFGDIVGNEVYITIDDVPGAVKGSNISLDIITANIAATYVVEGVEGTVVSGNDFTANKTTEKVKIKVQHGDAVVTYYLTFNFKQNQNKWLTPPVCAGAEVDNKLIPIAVPLFGDATYQYREKSTNTWKDESPTLAGVYEIKASVAEDPTGFYTGLETVIEATITDNTKKTINGYNDFKASPITYGKYLEESAISGHATYTTEITTSSGSGSWTFTVPEGGIAAAQNIIKGVSITLPIPLAEGDTIKYENGKITLTANVKGNFSWQNGKNEPTVPDSNKTRYNVIFTPSNDAINGSITYKDIYTPTTTALTVEVRRAFAKIENLKAGSLTLNQTLGFSGINGTATHDVFGESAVIVKGRFFWQSSSEDSTETNDSTVYGDTTTKFDVMFLPEDTVNYSIDYREIQVPQSLTENGRELDTMNIQINPGTKQEGFTAVLAAGEIEGTDILIFDKDLPSGTRLTLYADNQYYYYNADSAFSKVELSDFKPMGSTDAEAKFTDSVSKIQLCIDFANVSGGHTENAVVTMLQNYAGDSKAAAVVSLNPKISEGNIVISAAEAGANSISASVTVSNLDVTSDKTAVLAISLLNEADELMEFPSGVKVFIGPNGNEPALSIHGNLAIYDGTLTDGDYEISITGLKAGTYHLRADICDVPSDDTVVRYYPIADSMDFDKTDNVLNVTDASKFAIKVVEWTNKSRGMVSAGDKLALTVQYLAQENAAIRVVTQKRNGENCYDLLENWISVSEREVSESENVQEETFEVIIPEDVEPGTYRIKFSLENAVFNYNMIVTAK